MAPRRGYMARRIQRAFRKYRFRRNYVAGLKKGRYVRRTVGSLNPQPTFVETFKSDNDTVVVPAGGGVGKAFKVRINMIPQWGQYEALYKQYRINWVKVMLIPQTDGTAADINAFSYNYGQTLAGQGMGRIAWSIQDTPDVNDPPSEAAVLSDNGAKVRPFKSMWSCSFKPVPDLAMNNNGGQNVYTKQKYRQFLNFITDTVGNNPLHGAVQTFISLPGAAIGPSAPASTQTYHCYFKVNFTLRDPK